jgi:hypothetical protein
VAAKKRADIIKEAAELQVAAILAGPAAAGRVRVAVAGSVIVRVNDHGPVGSRATSTEYFRLVAAGFLGTVSWRYWLPSIVAKS